MTAEGAARRARLGPETCAHIRRMNDAAPGLSSEALEALAALFRPYLRDQRAKRSK